MTSLRIMDDLLFDTFKYTAIALRV